MAKRTIGDNTTIPKLCIIYLSSRGSFVSTCHKGKKNHNSKRGRVLLYILLGILYRVVQRRRKRAWIFFNLSSQDQIIQDFLEKASLIRPHKRVFEGQGRQDRKLAVAHHRRRNGRSEFVVAQNIKGISCSSDDSLIGIVTANLIGSKYHIWDQGSRINSQSKQSKPPLAVVSFVPTITTWTGSYRSMRVWVPKHQSMQLKNTTQIQHISGLPKDWEGKMDKVHQLFSRIPHYNNISKQYELDFRDRTRAGLRVQSSVKNFQLILEKNGRQTILQLGRVGKSKYVMDYRYPLTAYQAFCISLASINSKLCCAFSTSEHTDFDSSVAVTIFVWERVIIFRKVVEPNM
ncbi:hypothetical protein CsSME_00007300 [Camellia sinensis var. sinensis]